MGKEKGTDNKNSKFLRVKDLLFLLFLAFWGPRWPRKRGQTTKRDLLFLLFLAFWGPRWARRRGQITKAKDKKNNKFLRVNGQGFVVFVVFGLLGAQMGKEKGIDNKNIKSLTLHP